MPQNFPTVIYAVILCNFFCGSRNIQFVLFGFKSNLKKMKINSKYFLAHANCTSQSIFKYTFALFRINFFFKFLQNFLKKKNPLRVIWIYITSLRLVFDILQKPIQRQVLYFPNWISSFDKNNLSDYQVTRELWSFMLVYKLWKIFFILRG